MAVTADPESDAGDRRRGRPRRRMAPVVHLPARSWRVVWFRQQVRGAELLLRAGDKPFRISRNPGGGVELRALAAAQVAAPVPAQGTEGSTRACADGGGDH